ncbi:MAG: response regulator [Methanomicrobiales archaeon]
MSKIKVMVVEDESVVAIDIGQRLETLGYNVTSIVSSGEKAIEKAGEDKPDIILMDIVLKGKIDGIEAAQEIYKRYSIPVVYLTAYSDEKTLKRAKQTGPFGYIIKPFEDRELHSVIEVGLYKHEMDLKLRESEARYKAIVTSMNDIIFTLDHDKRCTSISESKLERYGVDKDKFIGKTAIETYGEKEGQIHDKAFTKALNGETVIYDWTSTTSTGKWFLQSSLSPLKDTKGDILGVLGVVRDITDLKIIQKELAHEAAINNAMFDLSQKLINPISIDEMAYLVLEYAKNITGSNYGFVGYIDSETGYLNTSTMTRDIWDKCHIPDKKAVFENFAGLWGWVLNNKKSLLTNDPQNDERSTGTPEGHIKIENFISAPAIADDKLVGNIALANSNENYNSEDLMVVERLADLYAVALIRKQSEDKLRESEEKNRRIIEKFLKIVSEVLKEINKP